MVTSAQGIGRWHIFQAMMDTDPAMMDAEFPIFNEKS